MEGLDGKDGKPGSRVRKKNIYIYNHMYCICLCVCCFCNSCFIFVLFLQSHRVNQDRLAPLDPGEYRY